MMTAEDRDNVTYLCPLPGLEAPAEGAVAKDEVAGDPGLPTELDQSAYHKLIAVGIALSAERDRDRLLEMIVRNAMSIAGADAGALYLRGNDERLHFAIMRTDSLGLA